MEPPRSRLSFGALRRVDRAALRPRALTRPPPPPERRFIASPRLRQGIVAGQINELEVGRRDFERSLPDAYQCPLRVRSRHSATSERCPLYPPKADIGTQSRKVRFTPESGHCSRTRSISACKPSGSAKPPNSAPRTARRARKSGPGQTATAGLWLIDPLDEYAS